MNKGVGCIQQKLLIFNAGPSRHRGCRSCDRREFHVNRSVEPEQITEVVSRTEDDASDFTVMNLGILSGDSRIVGLDVSSSNFRDVY